MTEVATFDAVIVGWGKGGKTLAAFLAGRGERVLMVEQSDRMYGGTCINIACVPTKALVGSANHPSIDGSAGTRYLDAVERKNALTALLRGKNYHLVADQETATVITGRARFTGPRELEVTAGEESLRVRGARVFVNTGAVPVLPPIAGITGRRVVTSTELIDEAQLPDRLVIIGGGPVALELGAAYARFGATVTILHRSPRLLPSEDDDVADLVEQVLRDDGITIVGDAAVSRIDDAEDHSIVHWSSGSSGSQTPADLVLVSVGRRAATDDLGLAAAGIETDDSGAIRVDDRLRTSAADVWAIGDVAGGRQFTYLSLDDFRVIRDQLVGAGKRTTTDRRAVPRTTFVTPPLSRVGLTEREARASGHRVKVATKRVEAIAAMPRARIVGDTRGLIKVVIDADSDLVLGAAVFCVDSQEIINLVALAMRHDVTATELRDTIYTHPSSTEALNEVLATIVTGAD